VRRVVQLWLVADRRVGWLVESFRRIPQCGFDSHGQDTAVANPIFKDTSRLGAAIRQPNLSRRRYVEFSNAIVKLRELYQPKIHMIRKDDHRRFIRRVEGFVNSAEGTAVLNCIRRCEAARTGGKAYRCKYPVCPACGTEQKTNKVIKIAPQVRAWTQKLGSNHVSFVTVSDVAHKSEDPCASTRRFKRKFQNVIARYLPNCWVVGELEIVFEEASSNDASSTEALAVCGFSSASTSNSPSHPSYVAGTASAQFVPAVECGLSEILEESVHGVGQEVLGPVSLSALGSEGRVMTTHYLAKPHLHGVLVHPSIRRDQLEKTLRRCFKTKGAVSALEITNKDRYGQCRDGIRTVLEYSFDKGSAVKGGKRQDDLPALQAAAFEAYCELTSGTRRRLQVRFGSPSDS
jgi:hypothetical protein